MRGLNLIVFSEVHDISPDAASWLKKLTGRNTIVADGKNRNISIQFKHEGTVIMTFNTDPGDLFREFPALIDRFFIVEFPNVCENPSRNLLSYLVDNSS